MPSGLERRNPLPVARYWLQLDADSAPSFDAWRRQYSGRVFSRATSTNHTDGWTWYLFDVTAELPWHAESWGYPTHAGPEVKSESDVLQLPAPQPGWVESAETAARKIGKTTIAFVVVSAVGLILLNRIFK